MNGLLRLEKNMNIFLILEKNT